MEARFAQARRPTIMVVAVLVTFLGLAAPSFADPGAAALGDASEATYPRTHMEAGSETLGSQVGGEPTGGTTPSATPPSSSALPFTGLSAALILATGLILLAVGFSLRLVASNRTAAG